MNNGDSRALVVAIDTSTDMLACALARLADGDAARGRVELLAAGDHMCRRHANEELVNTLDGVLAQAGVSMDEVDAVLVGRGPGSFTGVRIGVSAVKGLAWAAQKP